MCCPSDCRVSGNDYLTPEKLIALFEDFKAYNGIFYYLGSFVNYTESTYVVFKYIEAATKLDQLKEVERVCRDNDHYDPKEVKEFLLQQNLKDPRPLIHVCDRFDYVEELTHYLYQKNMFMFIEAYVQRMNSKATPPVVGALLDLNASDEQIQKLLSSVRPPVESNIWYEALVAEVEKRNRLKILRQFLEARANEGSVDAHVHNGLAKIYVDTNNNATNFLTTNKYYDSAIVGLYCESRDPHLAFIAYKRAWGTCDEQLIAVCNKNGFFKDEARYLVERQDLDLWAKVLVEENEFRRQLIDQVVATALPESRLPEEVSTTVKAFMAANLPNELIELLERIILHGPSDGEFATNRNLQNLLILTAIKADKKRVMDYIKRLNNYDGPDIAKIAISDQYELYEEAFFIYKVGRQCSRRTAPPFDALRHGSSPSMLFCRSASLCRRAEIQEGTDSDHNTQHTTHSHQPPHHYGSSFAKVLPAHGPPATSCGGRRHGGQRCTGGRSAARRHWPTGSGHRCRSALRAHTCGRTWTTNPWRTSR